MYKKVLLYSLSVSAIKSCDIFKSQTYISSVNELLTCLDVSKTFSFSDISDVSMLDLSNCIENGDMNQCNSDIETFILLSDDTVLGAIGQKLLDNPDHSCECIHDSASSLDNCISAIDQYDIYCTNFVINNKISQSDDGCDGEIAKYCSDTNPTVPDIISCLEVFTCISYCHCSLLLFFIYLCRIIYLI